ncbi:MAG: ATP-binding protein [Bacteroidota bacterium]
MEKERFSILIIDDDAKRNLILQTLLIPMDFSVISAYTGEEGIQLIKDHPPEMVILDVKLPDINGFDVLEKIKSQEFSKHCFVILISSVLINSDDQSKGFESGADGYLVFPLSNREFTARIQAFVRHKQTIDSLRNSEQHLKTVLENTSHGMLMIDYEGKIKFANNAAQRLFHRTASKMKNLVFGLPITGSEKTVIDIPVDENVITAEIEVTETGIGKQKVSIVTLHDITEYRKKAEKMTDQIDLLLNKERHQDKMFSMIAHDLRSPFNVLLNLTEALVEDNEDMSREEILRHLGSIYNSSQKVFNLLINLLEWSRIKTGNWQQYPQNINLRNSVSEVFVLYKEMAIKKNISLINRIPSDTQFYTDANILRALFRNLVSNAIKFTSQGGYIAVDAKPEGAYLKVWVEDNGVGMTDEKLHNLFDRDHMGEKTHQESGTGLGLFLCRELVEIVGGKLEITSKINQGTTVSCTFSIDVNQQ